MRRRTSMTDWVCTRHCVGNPLILASDENVPSNYPELLEETGLASVITTAQAAGRPRSVIQTDWNNFSPAHGFRLPG